jgi:hypothetical protein
MNKISFKWDSNPWLTKFTKLKPQSYEISLNKSGFEPTTHKILVPKRKLISIPTFSENQWEKFKWRKTKYFPIHKNDVRKYIFHLNKWQYFLHKPHLFKYNFSLSLNKYFVDEKHLGKNLKIERKEENKRVH